MEETTRSGSGRWFSTTLGLLAAALAVMVLLLARQNLALKHRLAEAAEGGAPAPSFEVGERFEAPRLLDATGAPATPLADDGAAPALVLVFSSTCPACRATFGTWGDSARRAAELGVAVVGIRLDAVPGEDPRTTLPPAIDFPVYAVDPASPGAMRKVRSVPTTVVLGADGRVAATWSGTLDADAAGALGIALRDVAPDPVRPASR